MAPWSGDRHQLRSRHVGDEFVIGVKRPQGYDRSTSSYPLLVTLDAHWLFGTVSDLATSLSMGRAVPRVLVAGIGWPTDDLAEIDRYRNRDTTPTAAPFPAEGFGNGSGRRGLGGAASFRRFVVEEALPYLADRYRVGGPKILIGHSFTGLFGVHLLLHEPAVFDGYLLASPSLWWDDRVTLRITEPELGPRRTPHPAQVYLSAGSEEGPPIGAQPFNMVGNVGELARRLATYPDLDVHFEVLPGENHHSTLGLLGRAGAYAISSPPPPAPPPSVSPPPRARPGPAGREGRGGPRRDGRRRGAGRSAPAVTSTSENSLPSGSRRSRRRSPSAPASPAVLAPSATSRSVSASRSSVNRSSWRRLGEAFQRSTSRNTSWLTPNAAPWSRMSAASFVTTS